MKNQLFVVRTVISMAGAVCFGLWQGSMAAGAFALVLLFWMQPPETGR